MKHYPITNSAVIGKAADGSPLRSWNEGPRSFIETYEYFPSSSGTLYGIIVVVEVTAK
jgi:hypothetical protein